MHAKSFSLVRLCATLWTVARLAWDSPGESTGGKSTCPPPGDLPHPGLGILSLTPPALAGRFFIASTTWEVRDTWESPVWALVNDITVTPHTLFMPRGVWTRNSLLLPQRIKLADIVSFSSVNASRLYITPYNV